MNRIVAIFVILLTVSSATVHANFKYSVKTKGSAPDLIYTINSQRSALPVYSTIPPYQRYTKLSVSKDGEQSIPLFIIRDDRGWWINGSTIASDSVLVGVAIDFSLREAYLIPNAIAIDVQNELQGVYANTKLNYDYKIDIINDSYKQSKSLDSKPLNSESVDGTSTQGKSVDETSTSKGSAGAKGVANEDTVSGRLIELIVVDASVFSMQQLKGFTKVLDSSSRAVTPKVRAGGVTGVKGADVNAKMNSTISILGAGDPINDLIFDTSDIAGKPLLNAATNGQIGLLNKVLKEYDINETDPKSGDNALMRSIRSGQVEAADILITAGIDIEHRNLKGQSAFHLACQSGNSILVEKLLRRGAGVNVVDNFRNTPLIYATSASNISIIELLLDRGAGIDHTTHSGQTAIMIAARKGHTRSVSTLADMGANLKATDKGGSNVLLEAIYNGNERTVSEVLARDSELLNIDDSSGNSPLQVAIINGSEPLTNMFIDAGADANHKNSAGDTVLISAVVNGNERNILKVLSVSPQLLAKDAQGKTAYDIAALKDDKLFTLLSLATDSVVISKADSAAVAPLLKGSSSELFSLAGRGDTSEIDRLIYGGGNVNITDPLTGNTPIYSAIANNNIQALDKLIKGGADINWRNKLSNTPLMVAVSSGSFASVERLIEHEADPNLKNNDGNTPLIWAVKLGYMDIVKVLLSGGAKVTIHNNSGVTPLRVAIGAANQEIEALLKSYGASY